MRHYHSCIRELSVSGRTESWVEFNDDTATHTASCNQRAAALVEMNLSLWQVLTRWDVRSGFYSAQQRSSFCSSFLLKLYLLKVRLYDLLHSYMIIL
jgi:hypothetical protein